MAKAMGTHVTGIASGPKLDMVRALGADAVLDYRQVDFTRTGERWNWILDTDSHAGVLAVRRALAPGGVYLTLGGATAKLLASIAVGPLVSLFSDRWSGLMLWWKPFNPPDVERVLSFVADGKVRPVIDRTYPLSQAREALQLVHEGKSRGKVVILP
jgi:NADPH:quinone reductase-like Zn-dependent oxidoreductase